VKSAEAFEKLYRATPDPWHFARSAYELNRYDVILSTLLRPHYHRVFEPGCSVGVLTQRLAERCDELIATDVAPTALEQARRRCASHPHVEFDLSAVEERLPRGRFDLIVFSEIGYYFSRTQLSRLAATLADSLEPHGELLTAHWLGDSDDHVLHGDEVHATLERVLPLTHWLAARHHGFRVDGWIRDV
jgi:2-polyprenyl-3-methyl-5-hydroxy-6-metoxy-1,4-benzoquinol methylase